MKILIEAYYQPTAKNRMIKSVPLVVSIAMVTLIIMATTTYLVQPAMGGGERHYRHHHAIETVPNSYYKTSRSNLNNQPICVNVPKNLTFCDALGRGNKMRLPNLLEHESIHEVQLHTSTWQQLHSTNCSPDLSLFLCSVLAPVCLDVIVPPCRSLCLSVRGNCEPIMKRHGYDWPRIIDCNKFPINRDMCISQQTTQQEDPESDPIDTSNHNVSLTNVGGKSTNGSDNEDTNHTTHKKRKTKKNRNSGRKNSTLTTSHPIVASNNPLIEPSPHDSATTISLVTEITKAPIIPIVPIVATSNYDTTNPINNTSAISSLTVSKDTVNYTNETTLHEPNADFVQLFCSTQSDWIIKTKISDSQLFRAQDKRKIKLRSFKQIYGQPTGLSRNTKYPPHLVLYLTNTTLALTYNQNSMHANSFDDLISSSSMSSITTIVGSNLSQSHTEGIKNEKTQLYLLAGKTSPANQHKLITMWMLYPRKETENNQSKEDRSPSMNQNLLKGYKEIKKRGVKVCNKFSGQSIKSGGSTSYKRDRLSSKRNRVNYHGAVI